MMFILMILNVTILLPKLNCTPYLVNSCVYTITMTGVSVPCLFDKISKETPGTGIYENLQVLHFGDLLCCEGAAC